MIITFTFPLNEKPTKKHQQSQKPGEGANFRKIRRKFLFLYFYIFSLPLPKQIFADEIKLPFSPPSTFTSISASPPLLHRDFSIWGKMVLREASNTRILRNRMKHLERKKFISLCLRKNSFIYRSPSVITLKAFDDSPDIREWGKKRCLMGGWETDALMNGVNKRGRLNIKVGEMVNGASFRAWCYITWS